jgi:hypothetical protein
MSVSFVKRNKAFPIISNPVSDSKGGFFLGSFGWEEEEDLFRVLNRITSPGPRVAFRNPVSRLSVLDGNNSKTVKVKELEKVSALMPAKEVSFLLIIVGGLVRQRTCSSEGSPRGK